ncbi:hypothetical protein AB205_0137460 [Aquarana catesbeiana]|uniref:Dol-P-Man:Man(5)GlcNAc(2)-PP-Dol alpha-1,3-mannosyltransferase n=1 Tax=Aquarana catesbeiana TaxID=8400 RepID=A0A2G9RKI7_AQUCT|nr:hypothetical protein AB205_0137460 [Aquarana catesbeiana]
MCCASYRVHSIFLLRLFNDPVAMVILFLSINLILQDHWSWGCIFYSCLCQNEHTSVSSRTAVRALLFSNPKIFSDSFNKTVQSVVRIHLVLVILALPFLLENPAGYLIRSFDFGRQFLFQWTVNWRFLPEHVFQHRVFHLALLTAHLAGLVWAEPSFSSEGSSTKETTFTPTFSKQYPYKKFFVCFFSEIYNLFNEDNVILLVFTPLEDLPPLYGCSEGCWVLPLGHSLGRQNPDSKLCLLLFSLGGLVLCVFHCAASHNFLGVTFSRSLHYQFYVWYFHTLPYLLWCTNTSALPGLAKILILGLIELSWNTFPSTSMSSGALHICHGAILLHLWLGVPPDETSPLESTPLTRTPRKKKD